MKKRNIFLLGLLGVIVVACFVLVMNWDYISDFYRGMSYTPSEDMSNILESLELTDKGEFIFKASQPVLSGRGEFNAHCRTDLNVETAILGCYTDKDIYVYDIDYKELDGIRELTTAHELLHAVWARMDDGERGGLKKYLEQVLEENKETLETEIEGYEASEKQEELYVRAGTEVAVLPMELEKHFSEIFKNQDKVVGFYDKYIAVFKQLQVEMDELKEQMEVLKEEIDEKTADYEKRAEQLKNDITDFNECAGTVGCFDSQWTFYMRRSDLISEREELAENYNGINELLEQYNELVNEYNEKVLYNNRLNNMINSAEEPASIE